ncbi:MAG TPA: squalene synthase HpnC [Myxococcota bacterium]|nr:squalene synthase HpnC [Myxococcota bacterium]
MSAGADALLDSSALRPEVILARASGENFPVALRFLPRELRGDLIALYGFARLVDQIGDEAPGDREQLLNAVAVDLARAFDGAPLHPLLQRLTPVIRRGALPRAAFERLIAANRRDQSRVRIASWSELLGYCALSANPIGELVLHLVGQADAARIERSDAVCSALQVIEHCQDVAEDFASGRVYLPADDLAAAGCADDQLARAPATPALRCVVALQIERARALLAEARPLVASLHGAARVVVAGYAAGGLACCDAFAAADYDPNQKLVRGSRLALLRHALALVVARAPAPLGARAR